MSSDEEKTHPVGDLFGYDSEGEEELSDLDDQSSDIDNNDTNAQDSYNESHQDDTNGPSDNAALAGYHEESQPILSNADVELPMATKLPSFKKRPRTEAEIAEAERIRQELRQSRKADGATESSKEPKELSEVEAIMKQFDETIAKATTTKRKRKKADEEDLERTMDEELMNLRERMKRAGDEDHIANNERRPALAKLNMLAEVSSTLSNKRLHDSILDNQLLDAIRFWLEPLPDRSLPSMDIQNEMLDALDKLPIASDHLRESGVGKIVYFYQKSPRVEPQVKRKADQLIAKWSRLIIKRSANYQERRHERREYSREEMMSKRPRYKPAEPEDESADDRRRRHVHIPQTVSADYDIIPESTIKITRHKSKEVGGAHKRLSSTMRGLKQNKLK